VKNARVVQGGVLLVELSEEEWGQIRETESRYAMSGKWKTDGCLCGAGPTKIRRIHSFSGRLAGNDRVEMHHIFRCVVCRELYENIVEQKSGKW